MNRRGFLGAMLGAMAAPAIVKAENLMKIVVPKKEIVFPDYVGLLASFAADFDGDAVTMRGHTRLFTHIDQMGFFPYRKSPEDKEIFLPSDSANWNNINDITAKIRAAPPQPGPLELPVIVRRKLWAGR